MQPRISFIKFLSLIAVALFAFPQQSEAGRVVKTKGRKVFIKLDAAEAGDMAEGDYLYMTSKSGKKYGIVIIRKKKGRLVIAKLGKGNAKKGMYTQLRKSNKSRSKSRPMETASDVALTESVEKRSDTMIGLLGSFGTATQNVTGVADMSGSTTGFKGIFDYELFSDFGVRARLGLDMLSVEGSSDNGDFATSISYLTIDLLLRYYLYRDDSFGFFLNGGMGIYSPMSTDLGTNQALQEDSISTTSLLIFGGGVAIPFGGWQIFLGGDYLYFPPSEDVDTSVISGKLGLIFEI